ncbi:YqkE family protein [Cohnella rhizosphaerae]|uniref:YqkE family protein n=1 Tax=Cohnella rhizosphaerae TaxID=1457232 RepID=A0A9X4QUR6_9BACL|nr:YqkE family protein [Cohnella rhizosphaerae]MDG0812546.1 YqkE family protein [Cohnella rhizosphaerae]
MAKKKSGAPRRPEAREAQPAAAGSTLKELLSAETLQKLKAHADSIKEEDRKQAEEKRAAEAEAKRAEEKRLDGDFGHLLDNSRLDWKSFK